MNTRAKRVTVVVSLVLLLMSAACGGATTGATGQARNPSASAGQVSGQPAGGSAMVHVTATNFAFAMDTKQIPAGQVTFMVTNTGGDMPHDFAIKGNGVDQRTPVLHNGQTASLTVDLRPGTYTYYCTIPGHDFLGMKGTFTVRP